MRYIIIEDYPTPTLATNEDGEVLIFDSYNEAMNNTWKFNGVKWDKLYQKPIVLPLNDKLIDLFASILKYLEFQANLGNEKAENLVNLLNDELNLF